MTTQSDSGSIEYAYRGVFENAYRILGYEIDGPKGQIKTGLLLTGTKDAFTLYDITDDGAFYFARHIDNSGTIQGRDYSIYSLSNVTSLITNSGTLKGDVVLGHGVDQVINTGKIFGALQTGDNTGDWFKSGDHVENHGIIRGIVTMSNFDDIFTAFGDARVGSVEAPKVVRGGLGNDTLTGANQNDKFRGNDGNDQLNGLGGNGGDDNLRGGPGQDQIIGGHGHDRLWGGTGADVFVFRAVADSAADAPSDRILNFEPGVDRIDLSQMSTDIAFVGDRVFSATGDVELRFSVLNSGTARVMLDVDGDGTGDLRFLVLDTLHLTTSDFIL
ncbi:M10 family metallopeptidase C-terminal domain-containing protein [Sedimentitalea nanhaiensis]|uniref:Hemolysin-type calcium-binding repeat-containing protein n=1 Tax=Sedimentitalea nanhaiensis TaxID=999627 RepID=A0A1I6Y0S0_9RHOB|nr:M10 family metallopeptidase C-terminal domain-containing protein [Sedimentitalea nanhaiensis]SFT43734.1 Hemolysin-type calcium-binding repeat-containing protein [Sedimentitalea nanhaiensis]